VGDQRSSAAYKIKAGPDYTMHPKKVHFFYLVDKGVIS
jgi:hypothetical protein